MFQEEKIPMKTREELIQLVEDSFNLGYWQLLMAFGDKDLCEKFPEEHKRFKDEISRLQKVENYIHEVCFKDKWWWNKIKITLEGGHTKKERQQAMTISLMFFYNRMKRWNDALFKRYESIFKYCENNNIDIKLNH